MDVFVNFERICYFGDVFLNVSFYINIQDYERIATIVSKDCSSLTKSCSNAYATSSSKHDCNYCIFCIDLTSYALSLIFRS